MQSQKERGYLMNLIKEITGLSEKEKISPARLKKLEAGRLSFWEFAKSVAPSFFKEERAYQKVLCNALQAAYEKRLYNDISPDPIDILIIDIPPGFGKSYTATTFTAWAYGQKKENIAITVSYNQTLSTRFAKTVRDTIEEKENPLDENDFVVQSFFPEVKIKRGDGAMNLWALEGEYMSYLASSFDGSITGMRGNIGIIDDPIKNKDEAYNENVKENQWDFYKNTFSSRMLPGALQGILMTRWATDDLVGRLLKKFPSRCYKLKMTAITEGESLCEDIYPLSDLLIKKATIDSDIWLANYMQEPIDKKGALYTRFETYDEMPEFEKICNYTDTADTGSDNLCSISFGISGDFAYILDIYYTKESMEITEKETAKRLKKVGVRQAAIESNNGGRGFARNVKRILKENFDYTKCSINWFHQSKNKKARILSNSSVVMERVLYPSDWEKKFPEFAKDIKSFNAKGKNAHDDCADALTGVAEVLIGDVKCGAGLNILKRR